MQQDAAELTGTSASPLCLAHPRNSGDITDGSLAPWSDTRTLSITAGQVITSVSVRLSLTGGLTGDLYGYLSHDGVQVALLLLALARRPLSPVAPGTARLDAVPATQPLLMVLVSLRGDR